MIALRSLAILLVLSPALGSAPTAAADPSTSGFRYVDAFGEVHYVRWQPTPGWRPPPRPEPPLERAPRKQREMRSGPGQLTPLHYWPLIREAARAYTLPEALLYAVMLVESGFDASAVSRRGAIGLMQLMPATASEMGVKNPYDPRQNTLGGARYLRLLTNRYDGDLLKTIAAYNAGPGAVDEHGGVPPFPETRRYVRRVLKAYYTQAQARARRSGAQ